MPNKNQERNIKQARTREADQENRGEAKHLSREILPSFDLKTLPNRKCDDDDNDDNNTATRNARDCQACETLR